MSNFHTFLASFKHNVSKPALEAGKKALKDNQESFTYTSNFFGISEQGGIKSQIGEPCHRSIGAMPGLYAHAIATENGWCRRKVPADKSIMEPFLRWFLYDSIYSAGIVNAADFEFCRDVGFIVSGSLPGPHLQNTMIMTRHFYEVSPWSFEKWIELVSEGFDPFLCYQVCFNVYRSANMSKGYTDESAVSSYVGHRVSDIFTPQDFKNYKEGDLVVSKGSPYEEIPTIYGGSKYFKQFPGVHDEFLKDPVLKKKLLEYRTPSKKEVYTPPNPFSAKIIQRNFPKNQMTYGELYNVYVPYIQETIFNV